MYASSRKTYHNIPDIVQALFDCTKQTVSYHMGKVFERGEMARLTVVKEFLITAQNGARAIISGRTSLLSV